MTHISQKEELLTDNLSLCYLLLHNIHTAEQWYRRAPYAYWEALKEKKVEETLHMSKMYMLYDTTIYKLLVKPAQEALILNNPQKSSNMLFDLLAVNNYDPIEAATVMYRWASKQGRLILNCMGSEIIQKVLMNTLPLMVQYHRYETKPATAYYCCDYHDAYRCLEKNLQTPIVGCCSIVEHPIAYNFELGQKPLVLEERVSRFGHVIDMPQALADLQEVLVLGKLNHKYMSSDAVCERLERQNNPYCTLSSKPQVYTTNAVILKLFEIVRLKEFNGAKFV
ncbi:ORF6 [White sturgeon adenovirus 1]|uniref:ORF6 n=1 Tax=White sturgeon adenovirus 1 TaxID=2580388 RepID=A0A4P8PIQ7_9ADEN|nr:ORF6 [White sturgeon adenovirus 1]QCQ84182.1 ORF6 [White sturgeon adenovirus 1]